MSRIVSVVVGGFALCALSVVPVVGAGPVSAAGTGAIHPGVQLFTNGAQCTANFIYSNGSATFIGQAAHCSSTAGNTATDGCSTPSLPLGTPVTISGASRPGVLAYNSWITMQAAHEPDPNVCAFNDLALVRIDPADVPNVDPSVPHWGGPTGLNTSGLNPLQNVYGYGNSELRLGLTLLSPKLGLGQGDNGNGWSHITTMLITPGIPGDSGSPLLDPSGAATGILSTVGVGIPGGVVNNYGDVSRELTYAANHQFGVSLVAGTAPFNPNQLPLG